MFKRITTYYAYVGLCNNGNVKVGYDKERVYFQSDLDGKVYKITKCYNRNVLSLSENKLEEVGSIHRTPQEALEVLKENISKDSRKDKFEIDHLIKAIDRKIENLNAWDKGFFNYLKYKWENWGL